MAKVIMTCGKICSGKSTYAQKMRIQNHAVVLSVDEITLALFGQHTGERHDEYVEKLEHFLYEKSLELIAGDINVILDWGFWTNAERAFAKQFYQKRHIACELHYIAVRDEVWEQRLRHRNRLILSGENNAYYVDENLAKKFRDIFEMPDRDEIDVWVG